MPNNNDTPTVPFDVSTIYQMLRDLRRELLDGHEATRKEVRDLSGRIALAQKDVINMAATMSTIAADSANSRVARLQQEIADQERERKVLEERIKIVDERLGEKKDAKDSAINTTGRMKIITKLTYDEQEQLKGDVKDALWEKRKEQIVTAVMISSSVGGVGAIVTFILWVVRFYLENR